MNTSKGSIFGKLAWMVVWFALGAVAGVLFAKAQKGADTEAPAASIPSTTQETAAETAPSPDWEEPGPSVAPGLTAEFTPGPAVAPGLTAEVAPGPAVAPGLTAGFAPEPTDMPVDEPLVSPESIPLETNREMVKQVILAYYEDLATDDLEGAKTHWASPTAGDVINMTDAIRIYGPIVVVPDTLTIASLKDKSAEVRFTVEATPASGGAERLFKKGATLMLIGDQWKIKNTYNP